MSSTFERFANWMQHSITLKLIVIAILMAILMIPKGMMLGLIHERESRLASTTSEIQQSWGKPQIIGGPLLQIPYTKRELNEDQEEVIATSYIYVLPEQLNIKGEMSPEKRHRGIFDVMVYESELHLSGSFTLPNWENMNIIPSDIRLDEAIVLYSITDLRGIQEQVTMKWNDETIFFDPGLPNQLLMQHIPMKDYERKRYDNSESSIFGSGISANIDLSTALPIYTFDVSIVLQGSESLRFVPLGKKTTTNIHANYPHPSFFGQFLPSDETITKEDFAATWNVLHVNRNFPQQFTGYKPDIASSVFGVKLLLPSDHYTKAERSIKYGILFLFLTFLAYVFMEVMVKVNIHPIQYLLVGSALSVFYLLLISLSEHMAFHQAYLWSALACTLVIVAFTQMLIKQWKSSIAIAVLLLLLYTFLYVLLQATEYSLLIGSIGIFVILSGIMLISAKMNWNRVKE